MEVLGLIPARGGSKGIPCKNLAPLAGRPLLQYTATAALESRRLSRVVLSTDDDAIAAAGARMGLEVPWLRSADLATDEVPMAEVVVDCLDRLGTEGYRPTAVVVLQPTSPLRRASDIDGALEILEDSGADCVVSVVEVPHAFSPVSVLRLEAGRLVPFHLGGQSILRRQDKPRAYARNGPAVLALRAETARRTGFYEGDVRPFEMRPEDSVDIDTAIDLELAEFWLERRGRGVHR